MRPYLFVGAALILVLAAGLYSAQVWMGMDEAEISGHGLFALGLGVFFTLVVGIGLMALVFYSNRRGWDDQSGPDR